MTNWLARTEALGLSPDAAALAASNYATITARFASNFGDTSRARYWWVPGRIEVLGKHTDYGGGRSFLCAVERGFHVIASPRDDSVVRLIDATTNASVTIPFEPDAPPRPGHWTDYPITVVRRVARDFPGACTGMNMVLKSSLPSASGLSSSSAFVIALFLPLAEFNQLRDRREWAGIGDADGLAEYLGAMENGRAVGRFAADRGVGTQGGSEDQTAILRAVPNHLLQYRFVPVTREATIPMPRGWQFAIGMSGVHAAKGGAVQARYNALAEEVATLIRAWRSGNASLDASLFAVLQRGPEVQGQLEEMIRRRPDARALMARLNQFAAESQMIIPGVAERLVDGDVPAIGPLVAYSQSLAEDVLGNQIAETVYLAQHATEIGAAAASAFGAGFGGSVWAMVRIEDTAAFLTRWASDYLAKFPDRAARAEFFATAAGPAAAELIP